MGKPRVFAGVQGRRARMRARRGISLRDAGITSNTQERYYHSVSKLLPLVMACTTLPQLDDQVSDWVVAEFEKGRPLGFVADGLSGLHYFLPYTRKHLPGAWKLFATWRKLEVPSRAPPITVDLILALASRALQRKNLEFAVLMLVGFHALLRTGEMLSISPSDFLLNNETGILRLPKSKSGTRRNTHEMVTIEDAVVRQVVQTLIDVRAAKLTAHLPIWQSSGTSFRQTFHRYLRFFRVEHLCFRPYSLRRGGATAFFQATGSMEATLLRGRCGSSGVARIYLCDALSQLPRLQIDPATRKVIQRYLSYFD